jgi:TfoX/Sxy family transcriptional regulator of competence genes
MAFDEDLADRIRELVGGQKKVTEKKMFGGIAFMVGGKMAVGIIGDDLMVRVGPESHDAALKLAHVRPMDFSGRPMKGYVYVAPQGIRTKAALLKWIDRGFNFAKTLT